MAKKINERQLRQIIRGVVNEGIDTLEGGIDKAHIQHVIDVLKDFQEIDVQFPGAIDAYYRSQDPTHVGSIGDFVEWLESTNFSIDSGQLWAEGYMMEPEVWDEESREWLDDDGREPSDDTER